MTFFDLGGAVPDGPHPQLPGGRVCVGCGGTTFRGDDEGALCPRCSFDTEALIERIELESLDRDLQLMTEFDAYYRQREEQRKRFKKLAGPVFARRPVLDPVSRPIPDLSADELRSELRALLLPVHQEREAAAEAAAVEPWELPRAS